MNTIAKGIKTISNLSLGLKVPNLFSYKINTIAKGMKTIIYLSLGLKVPHLFL